MTLTEDQHAEPATEPPQPVRLRVAAPAAVVLVLALLSWGGYGRHWSWTGINGRTATLWDWLHLLLLPAAFGVLPVLLKHRRHMTRSHGLLIAGCVSAFGALVLAGYAIPWSWTGFTGNTLWDWLELIALPIAVALSPLTDDLRRAWSRRHSYIVLTGGVAFAALVIGGYVGKWAWTGFTGNTVWDWLHLLLLPLLLPAVVVPRLKPAAAATLTRK
jgi:hypothetical protein